MSLQVAILGTQWDLEMFKVLGTSGVEFVDNKAYDDMRLICAFFHLMEQIYG
ncbi:hypothetical protein LCGC14_2025000 [marine sediment metagenome]|uniref:Uncharacterized protein n=1 Tax=marine sediment metagenome TaxID=412755 RepID=A0A0F9HTG4_9ZZZZ